MTTAREELELELEADKSVAPTEERHRIDALKPAESIPWEGVPESAEQSDYERRKSRRYVVPKVAFRIRVQRVLNIAVDRIHSSTANKFLFAFISIISVALIWFFLGHRMALIQDTFVEFSELGRLETELLKTREAWSQEEMQSLEERVENADKRRVFVDYRGLAQWLREKSEFAEQLDLNFTYTLQPGALSSIDDMLEVPIEVVITTNAGSADQTYLHFLEFMRYMVSSLWYVEIVEATIESENGNANRMVVALRVWVHGTVRKSDENT